MAPAFIVLILLMPAALAETTTSTQCINATLPDILDIGQCCGFSLDLCKATLTEIVAALVKVVQCLIDALLKIDGGDALSALLEIIKLVLNLLGIDVSALLAVVKPLCCVSNTSGCKTVFTGTETCKKPIFITLPGNLDLGKCLTDPLLLCSEGGPCTDNVLVALVNALQCLLKTCFGPNPGALLYGLACAVAGLLESAAVTATIIVKAVCLALAASIRLTVSCA